MRPPPPCPQLSPLDSFSAMFAERGKHNCETGQTGNMVAKDDLLL